jgi:hypothetical protein
MNLLRKIRKKIRAVKRTWLFLEEYPFVLVPIILLSTLPLPMFIEVVFIYSKYPELFSELISLSIHNQMFRLFDPFEMFNL